MRHINSQLRTRFLEQQETELVKHIRVLQRSDMNSQLRVQFLDQRKTEIMRCINS